MNGPVSAVHGGMGADARFSLAAECHSLRSGAVARRDK